MAEFAKDFPTRQAELQQLPTERLLVLIAAVAGLALGILEFVLDALQRPGLLGAAADPVLTLVITLLFSLLLVYAYLAFAEREAQGALLALGAGLVLLIFGGIAGAVAGILAVLGAAVVILRHVRWTA